MVWHYLYRVDHDLGFAPHIWRGVCSVCGCKRSTIERWARKGSWVVGIGGKGTGKSNKLIYAMQVDDTPTYEQFRREHPANAAYLAGHGIPLDAPVLVARRLFYYFGDHALPLPRELAHIVHPTQGCKRLTDADIELLRTNVLDHFEPGRHGRPNNDTGDRRCGDLKATRSLQWSDQGCVGQ